MPLVEAGCDALQLAAAAARGGEVGGGEHDLDVRRQQLRPPKRVGRLRGRAPDRCRGGLHVALGEAQQRLPRLGLQAEAARLTVSVLSCHELAPEAEHLALAVGRLRCRRRVLAIREALAGPAGLHQCVGPGAVQLHDLRTMEQARSGERHQVGLLLAPRRQGERPLLGAAQLVDLIAALDHAAVDEPAHDRRQLAGGDRHHRLVQAGEPVPNAAQRGERAALVDQPDGDEVAVAEALADLDCGCGCGARLLPVAG